MPNLSSDPMGAFDYKVSVILADDSFHLYANKVSGGVESWEDHSRYVGKRGVKVHARGKKDISPVSVEHGAFALNAANGGSKSLEKMLAVRAGDKDDTTRVKVIVSHLSAAGTIDHTVSYDLCQLMEFDTGDLDAQGDAVLLHKFSFQPGDKSIVAVAQQ